MKKTGFKEETKQRGGEFFDEEPPPSGSLELGADRAIKKEVDTSTTVLDTILTLVKWVFFYLPGVAAIHFAMMAMALMFFYGEFSPFLLLGQLLFGTFMIMLGLGKMQDLKYLKTVLTTIGFSLIAAVFYARLAGFIKGDFFGWYWLLSYPVIAAIGYLSKRSVDSEKAHETE
jgi:hypothetical protein